MTSLWQITDGKKFAQLIFSRNKLIDCEFLVDGGEIVDEFVDKLVKENNMLFYNQNKNSRVTRHRKYLENSNSRDTGTISNSNVTIVHLKRLQQIPEHFLELMNLRSLQKKCSQLHKHIRQQLQNIKRNDEEMRSDFKLQNESGRYEILDNLSFFDSHSPNTTRLNLSFFVKFFRFNFLVTIFFKI